MSIFVRVDGTAFKIPEEGDSYLWGTDFTNWVEAISEFTGNIACTANVVVITAAYNQANAARVQANAAFNQANAAYDQANTAYANGNTTAAQVTLSFNKANGAAVNALAAFSQANAAFGQANTATTIAGQAFMQANTALTDAALAFSEASAAYANGNTTAAQVTLAFNKANGAAVNALAAFVQANLAYAQANLALSTAQDSNLVIEAANSSNLVVIYTGNTVSIDTLITGGGGGGGNVSNVFSQNTSNLVVVTEANGQIQIDTRLPPGDGSGAANIAAGPGITVTGNLVSINVANDITWTGNNKWTGMHGTTVANSFGLLIGAGSQGANQFLQTITVGNTSAANFSTWRWITQNTGFISLTSFNDARSASFDAIFIQKGSTGNIVSIVYGDASDTTLHGFNGPVGINGNLFIQGADVKLAIANSYNQANAAYANGNTTAAQVTLAFNKANTGGAANVQTTANQISVGAATSNNILGYANLTYDPANSRIVLSSKMALGYNASANAVDVIWIGG